MIHLNSVRFLLYSVIILTSKSNLEKNSLLLKLLIDIML